MKNHDKTIRNGFLFIILLSLGHIIKGLFTIFGHVPVLLELQMGYFNLIAGMAYFGFYMFSAKVNIVSGFSNCLLFYLIESGVMLIIAVQRAPYFLVLMITVRLAVGTILFHACKRVTSLHQN